MSSGSDYRDHKVIRWSIAQKYAAHTILREGRLSQYRGKTS